MKETQLLPFERLLTFAESNTIKTMITKAVDTFESWGYSYIKLPAFDHYHLQEKVLGKGVKDTIVIKEAGNPDLVSLRADFTAQVVRSVSFLKVHHFPVRAYYFGTLFRASGDSLERFQVGIELLGVKELEGDAEVISALWDYVRSIGLRELTVSIGNVNIVNKVLSSVEEKYREQLREAFREKNLTVLKSHFGNGKVAELPLVSGKEEALEFLSEIGFEDEREELEKLGAILEDNGVSFIYDLSEVRDFPYYTGVVFEFFHRNVGVPIAGGGRYDSLSTLYGSDIPATGGTVYADSILPLLKPSRAEKDFFVIDLSKDKSYGLRLSRTLRSKGYKVGREIAQRALSHSLEHAFSEGFSKAVVVLDEKDVRIYTSVKDYTLTSLKDFLEFI